MDQGWATPQKAKRPESYQDGDNYPDADKSLLTPGELLHVCLLLALIIARRSPLT